MPRPFRVRAKRARPCRQTSIHWPLAITVSAALAVPLILLVFWAFQQHHTGNRVRVETADVRATSVVPMTAAPAQQTVQDSSVPPTASVDSKANTGAQSQAQSLARTVTDQRKRNEYWESRQSWTESELQQVLLAAPIVDLDANSDDNRTNSRRLLTSLETGRTESHPLLAMARTRADLAGLPFRGENDCRLDRKAARELADGSVRVRTLRAKHPNGPQRGAGHLLSPATYKSGRILGESAPVAALEQILQVESVEWRRALVTVASQVETAESSQVLARRALFDLDTSVRREAAAVLYHRNFDDFLPIFLSGFRHPWPIVAEHAAEAMIQIQSRSAASQLAELLDQPDPRAPFRESASGGTPVVRELVRINHLRNCLLCHAPLEPTKANDALNVPGAIPGFTQVLRGSSSGAYYTEGSAFVRADVTYLKQDFSISHSGDQPGPQERYDYFVRTRPATPAEERSAPERYYPQKEAVLAVLRNYTGMDLGDDVEAWRDVLRTKRK